MLNKWLVWLFFCLFNWGCWWSVNCVGICSYDPWCLHGGSSCCREAFSSDQRIDLFSHRPRCVALLKFSSHFTYFYHPVWCLEQSCGFSAGWKAARVSGRGNYMQPAGLSVCGGLCFDVSLFLEACLTHLILIQWIFIVIRKKTMFHTITAAASLIAVLKLPKRSLNFRLVSSVAVLSLLNKLS